MKKEIKRYILLAGAGCMILGGLILGSAMAMGGSPGFYLDWDGVHSLAKEVSKEPYILERTKLDPFTSAELYLDYGDLTILPSDGYYLEYQLSGANPKPFLSIEKGKLTFKERTSGNSGIYFGFHPISFFGSHEPTPECSATLYLPKDAYLESIRISNDCGNVNIDRLAGKDIQITNSSGDLRIHTLDGEHASLSCESGDLSLQSVKATEFHLQNEYGDVHLEEARLGRGKIQLEYGSLTASLTAARELKVKNESGDISLELTDPLSDYHCILNTEYGSIQLPDTTLEDTGEEISYTANTESKRLLDIRCENGDIRISER